jgi:dolichol-phosphate mannosyltransferase
MTIFFVLPLYNEEEGLPFLLEKISKTCTHLNLPFHIIAVNDGSSDRTMEMLQAWSPKTSLTVIKHKINRGLGETIRDGFEMAADLSTSEDIIIRMDGDNTHEPEYVATMISKIQEGFDVVIASRYQPGGGMVGVPWYRGFISRCANFFMKVLFPIKGVWEYSCGFRAYRATIIKRAISVFGNLFIDLKGLGFTCTVEKLIKLRMLNAKMTEIPFVLRYDQKENASKMVANITVIGYLVLVLKNLYPWGRHGKILKNETQRLAQIPSS